MDEEVCVWARGGGGCETSTHHRALAAAVNVASAELLAIAALGAIEALLDFMVIVWPVGPRDAL